MDKGEPNVPTELPTAASPNLDHENTGGRSHSLIPNFRNEWLGLYEICWYRRQWDAWAISRRVARDPVSLTGLPDHRPIRDLKSQQPQAQPKSYSGKTEGPL